MRSTHRWRANPVRYLVLVYVGLGLAVEVKSPAGIMRSADHREQTGVYINLPAGLWLAVSC